MERGGILLLNGDTLRVGVVLSTRPNAGGGHTYERAVIDILGSPGFAGAEFVFIVKSDSGYSVVPDGVEPIEFHLRPSRAGGFGRRSLRARVRSTTLVAAIEDVGIDLLYFASPVQALAEEFTQPYLATVWDLGIVELGHFPEFSGHYGRKMFDVLGGSLPRAFRVLVDSEATGNKLASYFSLDPSRIVPVGLPMPKLVEATKAPTPLPEDYVVYPSKYWPHKNHETLFSAFQILAHNQQDVKLMLTGIDASDFPAVVSRLDYYGISDAVVILPRIASGELLAVVKSARALVMPSMLGPTNYPPLEAMSVGTPVILSDAHSYDFDLPAGTMTVPCLDHYAWARAITEACGSKSSVEPFHPDSLFESKFSELLDEFRAVSRLWRS